MAIYRKYLFITVHTALNNEIEVMEIAPFVVFVGNMKKNKYYSVVPRKTCFVVNVNFPWISLNAFCRAEIRDHRTLTLLYFIALGGRKIIVILFSNIR